MNVLSKAYNLMSELPDQRAPSKHFLDLPTLVPHLLDLHPQWTFEDVREFLEEKTGRPVHTEDQITLRTVFQRCWRLRQEFEG